MLLTSGYRDAAREYSVFLRRQLCKQHRERFNPECFNKTHKGQPHTLRHRDCHTRNPSAHHTMPDTASIMPHSFLPVMVSPRKAQPPSSTSMVLLWPSTWEGRQGGRREGDEQRRVGRGKGEVAQACALAL